VKIFDVELVTARIKLRRISQEDLADMYEFTSIKSVTEFLEWDAHNSIVPTKEFISKTLNEYITKETTFTWGIEYLEHSKLIGTIRIYDYIPKYGRAEVSYIINPAYQGKGIMTEVLREIYYHCFNNLRMVRLQAKCSTKNLGSIKLLQKSGMVEEGCLRNYYSAHGIIHDSYVFAITSDNYFSLNGINK